MLPTANAVAAEAVAVNRKGEAAASEAALLEDEVVERYHIYQRSITLHRSKNALRSPPAPASCEHCPLDAQSAGPNVPT